MMSVSSVSWSHCFIVSPPLCVPECGAPVSVAGPAGGLVLPAQVWLSDMSLDCIGDQQTGAGP